MKATTKIDRCLSRRNGHLFIEDCDAVALVQQFGSPLYAVSEQQLRGNYRAFRDAFSHYWTEGPVQILPAMKANWILATRQILTDEGAGADIYSAGELHGVLRTGINPELVSVNGGGKSDEMLRQCIQAGVRITVEDVDEPARIDRIAGELNTTARIRFRVRPSFPGLWRLTDFSQEFASIDLGTQIYKSGVPQEHLAQLGRDVLKMKHVELTGFHFHGGRHHASLWYWTGVVTEYGRLIAEMSRAWGGYRPREIDIGGGFASHRDPMNKLGLRADVVKTCLSWPLQLVVKLLGRQPGYFLLGQYLKHAAQKKPNTRPAPAIRDYARITVTHLRKALQENGMDTGGITLQVEPGRALYGDAGIHLTRVKSVKRQSRPLPLNWILTDTSQYFMSTVNMDFSLNDFIVANKTDAPAVQLADVVGQSCAGDRILPFVKVPELAPGDTIALLDAGAYLEVASSNFNALPRPATVLVNGDTAELIRRAETIEDLYSRDVLPRRLEAGRVAA